MTKLCTICNENRPLASELVWRRKGEVLSLCISPNPAAIPPPESDKEVAHVCLKCGIQLLSELVGMEIDKLQRMIITSYGEGEEPTPPPHARN